MKILYLANLRLPTEKAYGIQIAKTCEAMASLGHDVLVVSPFRINKIKEDFFNYYSIEGNFKFKKIWAPDFYLPGKLDKITVNIKNLFSALCLCAYALAHKNDRIYTRDEWPAYFLSFFKKNIIFEAHKLYSSRKLFYKRFKRGKIKIVVISSGLKDDLISSGFPEEQTLLAPDGVDLIKFNLPISQKEAREKVNLPMDKKIIIYTGHLFDWKGAGVLLEVARNFQFPTSNFQNKKDVLFVFVGGTEGDVKEFRKKAEGLENVMILGHKPYNRIPLYLKSADILILPNSAKKKISARYTSPLKLFEYMVSKRPIVASDLPSLREILNESNCLFVQPDDPRDLTRVINEILSNEQIANQISQKAFQDAQNHTWQKRAEKIINFVND